MPRLLRALTVVLVLGAPLALLSACSDTPTSPTPTSIAAGLKPRDFAVCAYGEWQADGSCTGTVEYCTDRTASSGAFCAQDVSSCFLGCDNGGGSYGGGYYPPEAEINPDPWASVTTKH